MTRLGLILLAALATSTRATWPRLDEALANYPSIHARETARLKAGQPAKFVLVVHRLDELLAVARYGALAVAEGTARHFAVEDVDQVTKAIRQRALRSTRQHGLEIGVR